MSSVRHWFAVVQLLGLSKDHVSLSARESAVLLICHGATRDVENNIPPTRSLGGARPHSSTTAAETSVAVHAYI